MKRLMRFLERVIVGLMLIAVGCSLAGVLWLIVWFERLKRTPLW